MLPLVLFDLGNTLIYRDKSLIDFDVELIEKLSQLGKVVIKKEVSDLLIEHPEIYNFRVGSISNLGDEDERNYVFFESVFGKLEIPNSKLDEFIRLRNEEVRYLLFDGTVEMLSEMKKKFDLGIVTNGRPSRRRVVQQLKIDSFFTPEFVFISDEVGLAKPDEEFYKYIMNSVDNKNRKIYLCDDEDGNLRFSKEIMIVPVKVDHETFGYEPVYKLLQ